MTHARSEVSSRRILHIDMDAFYASVEQRDDPTLRGVPVAVGRGEGRGVVAAASYEARIFGIRSAMPSSVARRRCPHLRFIMPRFDVYRQISAQIREIFGRYTSLVQPLSLDEAYLDVTEAIEAFGSATAIAEKIRSDIRLETGLTASAGVSYNRFLAKLASDYRKPDGLFIITPRMGPTFVETLRVEHFHGIGPATAARMNQLGIMTGADLRQCSKDMLRAYFGKASDFYYGIARGIDERPVMLDRVRKSIGTETTLERDLRDHVEAEHVLREVAAKLWQSCERRRLTGRTVTLKVKYSDFQIVTRARSGALPLSGEKALLEQGTAALASLLPLHKGVRLLGLTVSALVPIDEDVKQPAFL